MHLTNKFKTICYAQIIFKKIYSIISKSFPFEYYKVASEFKATRKILML